MTLFTVWFVGFLLLCLITLYLFGNTRDASDYGLSGCLAFVFWLVVQLVWLVCILGSKVFILGV